MEADKRDVLDGLFREARNTESEKQFQSKSAPFSEQKSTY